MPASRRLLALLPLLAGACVSAPAPIAAPPPPLFEAQRLSDHIRTLSDDSFEGRAPATEGERKSIAYIVGQLQAAGAEPGGEMVGGKRQWTQAVPLLRSELSAVPQVIVRTAQGPRALVQGADIAVRSPMHGPSSVAIAGAPLLFVGYGVAAPERGWDDFKGVDVRGKILVELINDPDFEGGEGKFGGEAMTYYGRWTYKFEEAARRGAAGVMIVHETAPASSGWATVKNSNTNTMFDIVRTAPMAAHTPFESWIQRDTAVALFKAAGLDFEAARAAARRKDFQPIDLKASLDASLHATTETIDSHNIVGVLPGRTHPDETIVYSAHYDHLGVGQPDANGDAIYNGAVDNGTGVAQVIEQARAFAREPRSDRSIVFLLLTAEEKGLLGSAYYATHPLFPLAKTVAVLNTDSMGVNGAARNFSIAGQTRLELLDLLIAEGAREGRSFTPDAHPGAGGFFRSDHFSFAKAGVPALSFKSGNDLIDGGTARGEALAQDYVAKRYHQPDDEWQPDWNYDGMIADAALLHALGRQLADSRLWPNWSADSEFRAARDSSAAARN